MIEARADEASFTRVARALADEGDGQELRTDLAEGLHAALEPGLAEVRSALMGMATGGLPHGGEPLRQAVAAGTQIDVQLGGQSAGARISVSKHGMPRGFANAGKRLNQRQFRHRVYGRDMVVIQVGAPGWFDDTLARGATRYRLAAARALDNVADRIGRKS